MALKETAYTGLIYIDVEKSWSQSNWHVHTVISNHTHSQCVVIQKVKQ